MPGRSQRIKVLLEAKALRRSPAGRIRNNKQNTHYQFVLPAFVELQYAIDDPSLEVGV